MKYQSAVRAGLIACRVCGHLQRQPQARAHPGRSAPPRCARCGARLHRRQPDSLARTWALLLAAALLYIPANLLPVMHTASLGSATEDDTIMSGVVYFWTSGDWLLAVIVFVASILVPMLKLSVLALLAFTCQRRSTWRPAERARLYRLVEFIGRWSMLDVFVITLTVALVRFESLAVITAGPGAVAFGSVVILTMLASQAFDPRLIWDPVERAQDDPRATRITHAAHVARAAQGMRDPHGSDASSQMTAHESQLHESGAAPRTTAHEPHRHGLGASSQTTEHEPQLHESGATPQATKHEPRFFRQPVSDRPASASAPQAAENPAPSDSPPSRNPYTSQTPYTTQPPRDSRAPLPLRDPHSRSRHPHAAHSPFSEGPSS